MANMLSMLQAVLWAKGVHLGKVSFQFPTFPPFDEWLKGQPEEEVIRKARE